MRMLDKILGIDELKNKIEKMENSKRKSDVLEQKGYDKVGNYFVKVGTGFILGVPSYYFIKIFDVMSGVESKFSFGLKVEELEKFIHVLDKQFIMLKKREGIRIEEVSR